jgi:hypothetical protein
MTYLRGVAAALTCAAALVAGCGDDSSESGGGGGATEEQKITGAKVIDPGSMEGAKGNVSFCTGKDTSGSKTAGIRPSTRPTPASRSR